jgi:hypothetical protein
MPQLIEAPTYMLIIDAFLPHDGKLISNVKGKIGNIRESINRYGKSEMKYFTLIK